MHNFSINTTQSACNIGFIFDEHFTTLRSDLLHFQIMYRIRQLCCIRPYCDCKTASTIATFVVHSKLIIAILFTTFMIQQYHLIFHSTQG